MAEGESGALLPVAVVSGYGTAPLVPKRERSAYREDIDGLRAIAVIAVIIFHIDPSYLPGGFLGVDIFFVISGYVVTGSLLHAPQPNVCSYFSAFYARRLKRLTPALALFVAVTALLVPLVMGVDTPDDDLQLFYTSAQLATIGGANILYALQEATYWDTTLSRLDRNPFLHCWSLGVEEQFYLLFPGLLLALYPGKVLKPVASGEDGAKVDPTPAAAARSAAATAPLRAPVLVLAALSVLSLAAAVYASALAHAGSDAWANYVFYLSPFRFWQLACGVLLKLGLSLYPDAMAPLQREVDAHTMSMIALVVYALGFVFDGGAADALVQLAWAFATVSATVLFILAWAPHERSPAKPPFFHALCSTTPMRYIGKVSYQVYLWHWPAILFARQVVSRLGSNPATPFTPTLTLPIVASVVALAAVVGVAMPLLSHHIIEAPVRKWRPRELAAIGSMLSLIAMVCIWVLVLRGPLGEDLVLSTAPDFGCPESKDPSGFTAFISAGNANPTIPTVYGHSLARTSPSGGGCACRYCGLESALQPRDVTNASDASLCLTTYPGWHMANDFDDVSGDPDERGARPLLLRAQQAGVVLTNSPVANDLCTFPGVRTDVCPEAEGLGKWDPRFEGKFHGDVEAFANATAELAAACLLPNRTSPHLPTATMFLLGDSHAAKINAGMALAVRGQFQLRYFVTLGVGMLSRPQPRPLEEYVEGDYNRGARAVDFPGIIHTAHRLIYQRILAFLASEMRSGDVLVLMHLNERWDQVMVDAVEADLMQGVVAQTGAQLIVFGDWPTFRELAPSVTQKQSELLPFDYNILHFERFNASFRFAMAVDRLLPPMIKRWSQQAHYVPLFRFFCDAGLPTDDHGSAPRCAPNIPGTELRGYSTDCIHISNAGSVYLWPFLCDAMEEMGIL